MASSTRRKPPLNCSVETQPAMQGHQRELVMMGTLMNAATSNPLERAAWTPVALSLAVLCALVAIKSRTARPVI